MHLGRAAARASDDEHATNLMEVRERERQRGEKERREGERGRETRSYEPFAIHAAMH